MAIRVVRLGTSRVVGEGLRIGTVRRPPRGVRKEDFSRLDYFDVWLPQLAPVAELVSWALAEPFTPKRWQQYRRRYLKQMQAPDAMRLIRLLAALSTHTDFSVGCYCLDAAHCHRSLLRELLDAEGASMAEI